MASIEIEYCVPCGMLHPALKIEESLLEAFGEDIDTISLTTGGGGVLAVRLNGNTVYNNQRDGPEISLDELNELVESRLNVSA